MTTYVDTYYVIIGLDGAPLYSELKDSLAPGRNRSQGEMAWYGFVLAASRDEAIERAHKTAVRELFGGK